jgi:hypothetical protein
MSLDSGMGGRIKQSSKGFDQNFMSTGIVIF